MYSTNSLHSPVPSHSSTIFFRDHQSNRSASSVMGEQNYINKDTLDSVSNMDANNEIIVGPSDHYGVHAQFGNFTSNNPPTPTTLDSDSVITNLNATTSPLNNLNKYHQQQQQLHNLASDDHNHLHHQQKQYYDRTDNNKINTYGNGKHIDSSMFEDSELQHQQHEQEQLIKESTNNIKQQQQTSQLLQQYRQQMTANHFSQDQTKVCVFFNSRTPVIFKIPLPIDQVTLVDLKKALPSINQPGYKYFFRSNDQEFGDVKEEIQDDDCRLPISRNRIVAWIVTPNGSPADELASRMTTTTANKSDTLTNTTFDQTYTTTTGSRSYDGSSSLISGTDMESTSYLTETEDDDYSETSSSSASQSDATAVRCVTVQLVLTNENFLGLHISDGDHGIVVAEISDNSAVALDGRIEPGDKLIQVNDINLEELNNADAIEVLQAAVRKRGALKLVVAKFEDFSRPKDAIHPIDTAAWVAHTQAITIPNHASLTEDGQSATSSPSFGSNAHDTDRIRPSSAGFNSSNSSFKINKTADTKEIIQHMKFPNYGIDIKDREWLKIKIPKAFLGSQLVNWLERNVYGFSNSREAKKFATKMLKDGFIRDPISKKLFSSKSYYTFTI